MNETVGSLSQQNNSGAIKAAEKDHRGAFSFDAFCDIVKYTIFIDQLLHEFGVKDRGAEFRLSIREFNTGCARMSEFVGEEITKAESDSAFYTMNIDGYVLFDEFCEWHSTHKSKTLSQTTTGSVQIIDQDYPSRETSSEDMSGAGHDLRQQGVNQRGVNDRSGVDSTTVEMDRARTSSAKSAAGAEAQNSPCATKPSSKRNHRQGRGLFNCCAKPQSIGV